VVSLSQSVIVEMSHTGLIVELVFDRYEGLGRRSKKTVFTQDFVLKIKRTGFRFLKQQAGIFWQEVDDNLAQEKVSHMLRSCQSIKAGEREEKEEKANEHKKRSREI
jgi:hypothetical protein